MIDDDDGMPEIDFKSQSWFAVRQYAENRIGKLRRRNDGYLPPDQTASLRGSIAALKEILALETAPEIAADE